MNQIIPTIRHWPSCRADYPEKPVGQKPQQIDAMDIGDGERMFLCVDCGSSVVVDREGREIARDNP